MHHLNPDVAFHWVPGHVGLPVNERADEAARRASMAPVVAFPLPSSYAHIKSLVNRAALQVPECLLDDGVVQGFRSATWYVTVSRHTFPLHFSQFT